MTVPQPLVSVCMPAYNVAPFVAEAVRSVLDQTHRNLELVLVDDGSTDGTGAIVQSIRDDRLHYHRNPQNLGGFETMNRAISLARGEVIAVYHTDDRYDRAIVEKELAFLQAHPEVGAVFCLDYHIDAEGRVYGKTRFPKEFRANQSLNYREVFSHLLRHKNRLLRCPTFMARRSVLDAVGLFDGEKYGIAADLDLWLRIARRYPIAVLDEYLMYYRHFEEQWSNRYKRMRTSEELFFSIMDDHLAEYGGPLDRRDLVEYQFHHCADKTFRAANCVILGDRQGAMALLDAPFPFGTFLNGVERVKGRTLLLRALMRLGLSLAPVEAMKRLLVWSEYGGAL